MKLRIIANSHSVLEYYEDTKTVIATRGMNLSREDITHLLVTQQRALHKEHMMEYDTLIVFQLAARFAFSPYLSAERYVPCVADAIFAYYRIQRRIPHTLTDEEIGEVLYEDYVARGGVFKIDASMTQRIRRKEASYEV